VILAAFGDGQVAYSLLWFFLFFIEIWLEISIFIDIFRSHDLKGWAKGLWVVFVIVFPIIGILAYFIFRGDRMRAHQIEAAADQQEMFRRYMQETGGSRASKVEELHRLAELRDRGDISADEYERLKAEIMAQDRS
jgi:Short C-terminal domain/Phospholipase_D-nuclease N-terminal